MASQQEKTTYKRTWSNEKWTHGNGAKEIFNQQYRWSPNTCPKVKLYMTFQGSGDISVSLDAYTLSNSANNGKRSKKNIYSWTVDENDSIANTFSGDDLVVLDEQYCEVGVSFRGISNQCYVFSSGKLIVEVLQG